MRRRTKAGGKPAKARRRKPAAPKRRHAPKAAPGRRSSAAGSETEAARLTRELRDALDQQKATSELLRVISNSPIDLSPALGAIAKSAARLLDVTDADIMRVEGDVLRLVAKHGPSRQWPVGSTRSINRNWVAGRAAVDRTTVYVPDLQAAKSDFSQGAAYAEQYGHRTTLATPLLRDGKPIGVILIRRMDVRPFTSRQIELLQNFAAQAVIAIENTRLLSELRESLEQQTATSDVLRVISASPGELEPVFQAMLANATRICEANFGSMALLEGKVLRRVAIHNAPSEFVEFHGKSPVFDATVSATVNQLVTTKQLVHTADLLEKDPGSPLAKYAGARTLILVPLLKDDELVGVIGIYRQEVRPFTDKQIALVQNFAAQAVIAIENTRLLSELRESLEQQTATSEVLSVISTSPAKLEPVFQAMLENATRICEAKFGTLIRFEDGTVRLISQLGIPPALAEFMRKSPLRPGPRNPLGRVQSTRQPVHIADYSVDQGYLDRDPTTVAGVELGGMRTLLVVPMLKDDDLIGAFGIYRQEVRPFSDKQIALMQNFAAQAVIAIENARLLNELRQRTTDLTESLEQQAATSEVLNVISRSKFDLQPILQSVVDTAARLCRADTAVIFRLDQNMYRFAAGYCLDPQYMEIERTTPITPGPGTVVGRAAMRREVVRIADAMEDPLYDKKGDAAVAQVRSMMGVPLMREGEPIGVIALARQRVEPFVDREIELVSTFADQAAIAIENVRLFESVEARTRELARSLEDLQTAQDRLVQTEKLASLGQLTAGIAHEIKNPLNFVNNFAGVSVELIDELKETLAAVKADDRTQADIADVMETLRGNLEKIVQHGKRADSIVKNMLLHSREGSGEHRPVDVNALVEESLNLAYHGARAEKEGFNITLERSFDPAAGEVDLFPQEITRVLLNLISNGFYAATKRKGEAGDKDFEPVLAAATKNLGDGVEIKIRDNGTGIPAEVKAKMFNPFFTTKPAGEGTGLGLSISHDIIVKQHGGSIAVDTEPGKFTEFRIVLPREASSIAKTFNAKPGEQA
jgi:two-component system, NtrC family, sensor kinase